MSQREIVSTKKAPAAIGPYNQAVKLGNVVFTSGQIGLVPETGELAGADTKTQAHQAFRNLAAVAEAAGGSLADVVKFTLFLTDLSEFSEVNALMQEYVQEPYPARSTVEVSALPKGARFEVDAILSI